MKVFTATMEPSMEGIIGLEMDKFCGTTQNRTFGLLALRRKRVQQDGFMTNPKIILYLLWTQ